MIDKFVFLYRIEVVSYRCLTKEETEEEEEEEEEGKGKGKGV